MCLHSTPANTLKRIPDRQVNSYIHASVPMDVIDMVKSVPPKSCELDPIPTKILNDHIGALAYRIAKIINTSFDQSYVCDNLKEAILRPLIKSSQLDLLFPNFRPVSNLA